MSRNGDKKPVGFATQLIAGGSAGAMEAVSNLFKCIIYRIVVDCMLNPPWSPFSYAVSR